MRDTLSALHRTPIRSIVESARKTGISASPMRIPFALSPMARASNNNNNTPNTLNLHAKEPSMAIKEAFSECKSKRPFEEDGPNESLQEMSLQEPSTPTRSSRKSSRTETESFVNQNSTFNDFFVDPKDPQLGSPSIPDAQISRGGLHEMVNGENEMVIERNEMAIEEANQSFEVVDEMDCSKSEPFEKEAFEIAKEVELPNDAPNKSFESNFSSKSSSHHSIPFKSNASAASTNPLLPSGIVKLLEKKRQETTATTTHSKPNVIPPKKKFDLQESLKRSLNYKPHTGPLNKKP